MSKYTKTLIKYFISILIILNVIFTNVIIADNSNLKKDFENVNEINHICVNFESHNFTLFGEIYYPIDESQIYPCIIFCEGKGGYSSAYDWITTDLSKENYIVFIFDFPGQGKSEGIYPIWAYSIPSLNVYIRPLAIKEVDMHWRNGLLNNVTIEAVDYLLEESPVKHLIDTSKIGMIGHSTGGTTVTDVAAMDKRIGAVVALAHATPDSVNQSNIPIQLQCGTFDQTRSIRRWIIPSYEMGNPPKELIIIQAGTHGGFSSIFRNLCPCPSWQKEICFRYTLGWFDYFLKNKEEAYEIITTGTNHLGIVIQSGKIYRSCYNFGYGEIILE